MTEILKVVIINRASKFFKKTGIVVGRGPDPKEIGLDLPPGYIIKFPGCKKIIFGPDEFYFIGKL
jgi:hypothetical protein